MINIKSYKIFVNHLQTLKETSKDNRTKDNVQYMTESDLEVISFDLVKREYAKSLQHSEDCASSVDAVFLLKDRILFIEFKNGNVEPAVIKKKIRDSLLIFLDIVKKTVRYSRNIIDFILVYNQDQYLTDNREKIQDDKHPEMPEKCQLKLSQSMEFIGNYIAEQANSEIIKFDLAQFQGFYFREVHTYPQEKFERYLDEIKPFFFKRKLMKNSHNK